MGKFSGKRALVTGAGAGIGRALALKLSELGAEVIALSKTAANLESLKEECPALTTVCVDLSDWDTVREAVKKLTPIHFLVNNAALIKHEPFLTASPESFDRLYSVNVKALINVSQVVAGDLVERGEPGAIVNVSSICGQRPLENHAIYGSTKGAVDNLTQTMALELGPKGIRVNAVSPTVVLTAMGKIVFSDPNKCAPMLARTPQGTFASVDHVVNAIVFLLSEESDMIHGHMLPVDGGYIAV